MDLTSLQSDITLRRPLAEMEEASPAAIRRRKIMRRAVEAVIWGVPLVSVDAMRQAYFRDANAKYNDIIYFSKPADWHVQITTPNSSSYYVLCHYNLREGAVVLDIPPAKDAGLFGSVNDAWQTPMVDVGPEGEDRGAGGKYLLLPPGDRRQVPEGYIPVRCATYNGYMLLRAIPATQSERDVSKAMSLIKQLQVYRLDGDRPAQQRFIDMSGKIFDGIVRFDDGFFESLARMVREEPVQERDLAILGQFAMLGIGKKITFSPDAETCSILQEAAEQAQRELIAATTQGAPYWPQTQWIVSVNTGPKTEFSFKTAEMLDIDERGMVFFLACAPPKKLGAATFYLGAWRDALGDEFDGGKNYRLRVPAHVPAKQYWAVTVYDCETAAFILDSRRLSVDSYGETVLKNDDGSVDVYFGPLAPPGKKNNWIYTEPGKKWFAFFRFYGPDEAVFDKTWSLSDIVPLDSYN